MSLYGKYRPQNFTNLVGQDHIRETILHEIQKGTLTHAYLFAGPRGTGKTSTARLIAKALNCDQREAFTASDNAKPATGGPRDRSEIGSRGSQSNEAELKNKIPCDECDFCKTIAEGSLIDVIEIDAASNRGIDEIRDLKEKIQFAPTRAQTKTYIIDEVHMLTKEAFNALLKTLEEPPENVYFILCTTEIHKIPETIISRCQRFDFKRIDVRTIMTRLNYIAQMEGVQVEDAAIELIARHVEGGLRDAIGLLEQMTIDNKLLADHVREHLGITGHHTITTLLDLLEKKELQKALALINDVHNEGYDLMAFVREILECLRERLITGIQQNQPDAMRWLSVIAHFEEARDMLRNTVIPQLPLEIAVIKICPQATPSEQKDEVQIPQTTQSAQTAEKETAATLKKEYEIASVSEREGEAPIRLGRLEGATRAPIMERYTSGPLQEQWKRVLEHVQPPSLQRSLAQAIIKEKDDGSALLAFGSRFHMEKVNTVENRTKIEKAVAHILGKTIKLSCELDLAAGVETSYVPTPAATPEPKSKKATVNLAKKALEIFGSEE